MQGARPTKGVQRATSSVRRTTGLRRLPSTSELEHVGAVACSSGCGFLATWHDTCCCHACAAGGIQGTTGTIQHGPHCEKVAVTALDLVLQPASRSTTTAALSLREFAALAARGMGAIRQQGRWVYDTSHSPRSEHLPNLPTAPRFLPLMLRIRVLAPPSELCAGVEAASRSQRVRHSVPLLVDHLPTDALDAPELALSWYSDTPARPALLFYEPSDAPVLPPTLTSADGAEALPPPPVAEAASGVSAAELLFWRIVCTDSCEVTSMALALCLRRLHAYGVLPLHDGT